jgi:hypothetical protein
MILAVFFSFLITCKFEVDSSLLRAITTYAVKNDWVDSTKDVRLFISTSVKYTAKEDTLQVAGCRIFVKESDSFKRLNNNINIVSVGQFGDDWFVEVDAMYGGELTNRYIYFTVKEGKVVINRAAVNYTSIE